MAAKGNAIPPGGGRGTQRKPGFTVREGIDAYIEYLAHEQHASRDTQVGYKSHLRRFHRHLAGRLGREPNIAEVTEEDLRDYNYSLSCAGLRPRSLRGVMQPVRNLFEMAKDRGWRPDNPALAIKLPKKDAPKQDTVSDEEFEQLLAGCNRVAKPTRRALLKAVLAILNYQCLRRQEALDLLVSDINLIENRVLVRSGKGAKSRNLPACQDCMKALREWLDVRPATNDPHLFLIDRRRPLGEVGLVNLVAEAKALADLGDHANIHPHAMRRGGATRMLRNGADLRAIQQFLGHSNIQQTAEYLHVDEERLKQVVECAALPRTREEGRGRNVVSTRRDTPRGRMRRGVDRGAAGARCDTVSSRSITATRRRSTRQRW